MPYSRELTIYRLLKIRDRFRIGKDVIYYELYWEKLENEPAHWYFAIYHVFHMLLIDRNSGAFDVCAS